MPVATATLVKMADAPAASRKFLKAMPVLLWLASAVNKVPTAPTMFVHQTVLPVMTMTTMMMVIMSHWRATAPTTVNAMQSKTSSVYPKAAGKTAGRVNAL